MCFSFVHIALSVRLFAGTINQSLLTLGRVITALVERAPHVPYRWNVNFALLIGLYLNWQSRSLLSGNCSAKSLKGKIVLWMDNEKYAPFRCRISCTSWEWSCLNHSKCTVFSTGAFLVCFFQGEQIDKIVTRLAWRSYQDLYHCYNIACIL